MNVPNFCSNKFTDNDYYLFRHGIGRTDFYILNDSELSFRDMINKNAMTVGANILKPDIPNSVKPEKPENDIVRVDQNQIVVKLEKGEGTLQIEKVGLIKKEPASEESVSVDISFVKSEPEDSTTGGSSSAVLVADVVESQVVSSPLVAEKDDAVLDTKTESKMETEDKVDETIEKETVEEESQNTISVCCFVELIFIVFCYEVQFMFFLALR